jgi:membrane associated rhomboid family serine protease
MFPLNDTEPNRYSFFPIMTVILIVINCFIYYVEIFVIGENYWPFFMKYAATPRLILNAQGGGALSNVTAMFLHGSLFHLLGNVLALWVFGRRVEDACGPWRFLAFYLLAGTWAHVLFILVQSDSRIPGIGASGAIFGLMGAYLLLYPGGRIRTLIFVSIIPAIQILRREADYSINHWAHLGGFFSAVFILLFLRPEAFARYLSDTSV